MKDNRPFDKYDTVWDHFGPPSTGFAPPLQRGRIHRRGHRWFDADPVPSKMAWVGQPWPGATLLCGEETVAVGGGIWSVVYPEPPGLDNPVREAEAHAVIVGIKDEDLA